ncbi:hypothetical protein So717_22850 [Roseobacter cerasinus]|uniref:Uncharacterized protein n=1 Tax=Roseobacter cerasinus TaxID=2602289 RepID=A0A640VS77_9RHOB|nr:hypothetical protein [Roseobacter cerasinus]GFE50532.1 hypothetical protein So717_22850 [Roseobacter cerasinus]
MKHNTDPPPNARPAIRLNIEDWLPYLAEPDMPETEKIALIETLWSIVLAFVDLGWDYDAGEKTSGQSVDLTAVLRQAVLNSEGTKTEDEEPA